MTDRLLISSIILIFAFGIILGASMDHTLYLNNDSTSKQIQKVTVNNSTSQKNSTVDILTLDAATYDNNTADCNKKRYEFIQDPTKSEFRCNGELTIKTSNQTYTDSQGHQVIINHKWYFTMDDNSTMTLEQMKRCYQDFSMQHEVCN